MWRKPLLLAVALAVGSAGSLAGAASDADARCLRLESRIADLRVKMRLGYSAREGRVYRQKLASLEAERRQRCRR